MPAPLPMTHRTVVIGAGTAGIAAARTLHNAGRDVLLLEARDAIGGRARTLHLGDHPLDAGCGWLHSARRNPWVAIARARGLTIDTSTARWGEQWRDLGYPLEAQRAFADARDRWEARARAAATGPDRPLSDFVTADDPWHAMLDAISGFANGAPLEQVSLHDWLAYEDAAGADNWSVREGYGTLVAGHAHGVPLRSGCAATRVDRTGPALRIDTAAGTIKAAAAIVAVPTSVLAQERLTFDPPLPDKHAAATALPLGLANKAFLRVTGALPWPADTHLIGNPHAPDTGSYRLSPFGWPVVEAFFGGAGAETLEARDAAAFAIDELVALLGSDWRARLAPLHVTRWRQEAWIGGSYSHALPGHAGARAALAAPVENRLFFAGEACSPHDFSTAHGAYQTGIAAAQAVLARG